MALKSRRANENFKPNKVYLSQKLKCAGGMADLTENVPYINIPWEIFLYNSIYKSEIALYKIIYICM